VLRAESLRFGHGVAEWKRCSYESSPCEIGEHGVEGTIAFPRSDLASKHSQPQCVAKFQMMEPRDG
jgi:hypothetical protein